jgi:hypothetical protein
VLIKAPKVLNTTVSFDVTGPTATMEAATLAAGPLDSALAAAGLTVSSVNNPFGFTVTAGTVDFTSSAPSLTLDVPTGLTAPPVAPGSNTLTQPAGFVEFTFDTGLELLRGAVDMSKPLPERLRLVNSNIEPNSDSTFSGASLTGTNPSSQSDVELNLVSLGNNLTTALSHTVIQLGRDQLQARFQDTDNSGAATTVKLDALTARSLGLDAIDISSQESAQASMDLLENIKTKLLDNMATVAKGQGEVETAKAQIETNIIATNKVLEVIDGVDPLEIAQIMSQEKQKIQQTIAIMTSQTEQQSAISQGAQQIMRG